MDNHHESFLLRDSRTNCGGNLMFWAAKGSYTTDINQAEVFTRQEAVEQHSSRRSDTPIPLDYLRKQARPTVDVQYLHTDEAKAYQGGEVLIQRLGEWDGNDAVWIACPELREKTTNFSLAHAFQIAPEIDGEWMQCWPKAYIQQKIRMSVAVADVSIQDALAGTGVELQPEPQKEKMVRRHRCAACGIFMTAENYWLNRCSRCGTENR